MYKKKQHQKPGYIPEKKNIVETVRRSQFSISNDFELKKLSRPQEGFLDCSVEEDQEDLIFSYDIRHVFPWTEIRREKRELMISALIDAGKLQKTAELYQFTLAPENLYYDIQGRVFVKARDVYGAEREYSAEASEVIAEIASLTERIPSQIRSNELLEACASAQAEIKSVDFLSYGQKVYQGLQNLLDHNQYITEHFIKNMGTHTEKMRGLGEEFRRLTDSITYCGKSEHTEGMSSVVYSGESEHTEGMSSIDDESETERIDRIIENLPTRDGLLRQAAAKMAGITLNGYGTPVTDNLTDYNNYLCALRKGDYSYGEIAKILTGSINSKCDMEIYQKYLNWLKPVGYLAYDREGSITQNEEEGFYVIYSIPTLDSSYDQYHMSDIYHESGIDSYGALQSYGGTGSVLNTGGDRITYGGQQNDFKPEEDGTLMYNGIPRYAIALAPKLQNPNFNFDKENEENNYGLKIDTDGKLVIDPDYISYGTCVDVVIIEDNVPYFIPAIIVDVKEHTAPSGLVQTYVNFNGDDENDENTVSGNIIEWYHIQTEDGKNRSDALRAYNSNAEILIYREEVLR